MRILSSFFNWVGAHTLSRKIRFVAVQQTNQIESLFYGLCLFGRRFQIYSDNHGRVIPANFNDYQEKGYCRGACYWLIEKSFKNPHLSLSHLAQAFENGMPEEVVRLHESRNLPDDLLEENLWAYRLNAEWDQIPFPREPGIYSFRIGFWNNEETLQKAHRFALFQSKSTDLFDPSIGLIRMNKKDWIFYLKETLGHFHLHPEGFYTIEAFRHDLRVR